MNQKVYSKYQLDHGNKNHNNFNSRNNSGNKRQTQGTSVCSVSSVPSALQQAGPAMDTSLPASPSLIQTVKQKWKETNQNVDLNKTAWKPSCADSSKHYS